MYNDVVLDHFQNPRNVGEIENPSAYAKLASPSCGDLIEIFMNIDENEVITDVKFRTLGCAAAIASGSMATEMLKGKTVEEARKLTNQEVVENLGGLEAGQPVRENLLGRPAPRPFPPAATPLQKFKRIYFKWGWG